MTNPEVVDRSVEGRAYRSPLRQAQAAATRSAVLAAAADLFEREGYLRTTMKTIAGAAGVSVETVYSQGAKPALLLACMDRALAGDDAPLPLLERADFVAALAAETPEQVIRGFVTALTDVAIRAAGLLVAFEDAAAADVTTAELWALAEQDRRRDYRRLVEAVAAQVPLRDGLGIEEATDGIWATSTPRLAHQLGTLGWSRRRRIDWMTALTIAVLLPAEPAEETTP